MIKKSRPRGRNAGRTNNLKGSMTDDSTVDRPVNVEFRDQLIAHGWRVDSAEFLATRTAAEIAANLGPRFMTRLRRELRLSTRQLPPREDEQ